MLQVVASAFSIYLGYRLFILGVTGEASLFVKTERFSAQLLNAAPGIFFAIGGFVCLHASIRKSLSSLLLTHPEIGSFACSNPSPLILRELDLDLSKGKPNQAPEDTSRKLADPQR